MGGRRDRSPLGVLAGGPARTKRYACSLTAVFSLLITGWGLALSQSVSSPSQSSAATGQSGATPSAPATPQAGSDQSKPGGEISAENSQPTFALHVQHNEVLVRVVVRDAKGQAVSNLRKDDFRIFDNRKPQVITHFAVETSGAPKAAPGTESATVAAGSAPAAPAPVTIILPHRFMALFFDDIHTEFGDLARTRDAADHYLVTDLKPGDRAGIFTASGQGQLDFTDDRQKLHDALLRLRTRPMHSSNGMCPQIFDYEAYKIAEQQDPTALQAAEADAVAECCGGNPQLCSQADPNYLNMLSRGILTDLEVSSRYVFQGLEGLCRRMAILPGQRSIVLLSPGFFADTEIYELQQVIERALRENAVISTLDARGLYVDIPGGDASQAGPANPQTAALETQIHSEALMADANVLASLAGETGGVYFHNNNDYAEGLRRTGAFPEAYYVLAFAPEDLKTDGRMHTLKVTLASNPDHFALQARKAYFAPRKDEDAATLAKEELEEMVFSQEESQTIPTRIHTQFFKTTAGVTKLSVVTRIDVTHMRFKKSADRNADDLVLVTSLFDRAANFVDAKQTSIKFQLLDATLGKLTHDGLSVRQSFDVKPGTYLVRSVVQESQGEQLSAMNSQVEIP
jgi:VWFA-related protein